MNTLRIDMNRGIGGLPSWAVLIGFGGIAFVLLSKGVLEPAYRIFGQTIRTINAAGLVIGLGLVVVTLAMVMWAIGQLGRLG